MCTSSKICSVRARCCCIQLPGIGKTYTSVPRRSCKQLLRDASVSESSCSLIGKLGVPQRRVFAYWKFRNQMQVERWTIYISCGYAGGGEEEAFPVRKRCLRKHSAEWLTSAREMVTRTVFLSLRRGPVNHVRGRLAARTIIDVRKLFNTNWSTVTFNL